MRNPKEGLVRGYIKGFSEGGPIYKGGKGILGRIFGIKSKTKRRYRQKKKNTRRRRR